MESPANQNRQTLMTATKCGARLFRSNVGLAWIGEVVAKGQDWLKIKDPRPFRAGIPGMSDSNGWISVEVTPAMVGTRIAVFLAIEDKQGSGRTSPDQRAYIEAVRRAGGRAGVSRSDEDTAAICRGEIRD